MESIIESIIVTQHLLKESWHDGFYEFSFFGLFGRCGIGWMAFKVAVAVVRRIIYMVVVFLLYKSGILTALWLTLTSN